MPKATIRDGLELSYDLRGPDQAPALVLITGLGGLKEGWFHQLAGLSEDLRVLAFDNRGMGGSTVIDAPFTLRDMAEDAVLLMDALGLEHAHLWGVSMGGKIAQEVALAWPDRVERLVLENTTVGEAHRVEGGTGDSPLKRIADLDAEGWLREIVPLLFGPEYRENNPGAMRAFARSRERHPADPVALKRQWEAYEGFDSWDRLPEIHHRTLVLVGSEDGLTDPRNGARLAERLPDAVLYEVEGGGHSVHLEMYDEVNAIVRRFLQTGAV